VPYEIEPSNGAFNFGTAFGFVQSLPFNVYIAMNGRALLWDCAHKNSESHIFEVKQ